MVGNEKKDTASSVHTNNVSADQAAPSQSIDVARNSNIYSTKSSLSEENDRLKAQMLGLKLEVARLSRKPNQATILNSSLPPPLASSSSLPLPPSSLRAATAQRSQTSWRFYSDKVKKITTSFPFSQYSIQDLENIRSDDDDSNRDSKNRSTSSSATDSTGLDASMTDNSIMHHRTVSTPPPPSPSRVKTQRARLKSNVPDIYTSRAEDDIELVSSYHGVESQSTRSLLTHQVNILDNGRDECDEIFDSEDEDDDILKRHLKVNTGNNDEDDDDDTLTDGTEDLNFWRNLYDRSAWLVGLMVLQSCSSFILKRNKQLLEKHSIIVQFLTMLVGAGGNAGNQASVRVIRGLAVGSLNHRTRHFFLKEEVKMAFCMSIILGVAGFIRAMAFMTPLAETIAITTSLVIIVMISIVLGVLLPLGFNAIRIDPAHSSTTIQVLMDILGVTLTVYIGGAILDSNRW